jgi:hypothetical protein
MEDFVIRFVGALPAPPTSRLKLFCRSGPVGEVLGSNAAVDALLLNRH